MNLGGEIARLFIFAAGWAVVGMVLAAVGVVCLLGGAGWLIWFLASHLTVGWV